MGYKKIESIGLAKESESPENPGGLEKRVAMIPSDIKKLVNNGHEVYFEEGAGDGIGYSDKDYITAGAKPQNSDQIYKDKDMVLKFKGPSLENTAKMNPGTILFCMAHFRSFPERAELMMTRKINVIAMEEILESPKFISDEIILSKCFAKKNLESIDQPSNELHFNFLGYDSKMIGALRRVGNRNPKTQTLFQTDVQLEELNHFGPSAIYYYDSRVFHNTDLLEKLKSQSCRLFDLKEFETSHGQKAISEYRETHPAFEFGGRRIQCLHETGMAGARYGFTLHKKNLGEKYSAKNIETSVLGYGNVGMGAIRESYDQGSRKIQILGRSHTQADKIGPFIKTSNLIVNGAEQPPELRGVNYLIKSSYVGDIIKKGAVVIDLVGGSATNRSPVEDIVECSYLTNPHFVRDEVTFSGLWGWPMMGMMKESAHTYSGQILDVLIGKENLVSGLDQLAPGVKPALVCGPH